MKFLEQPIFFAIILILNNTSPLLAASFDCKKARTDIEKMICNSSQLSKADEQMGIAYKKLRHKLPKSERQLLLNDQRTWLQERDNVLRTCIEIDCEIQFYQVRIQQLGPIERVSFNCQKAATPLEKMICNSPLLGHVDGRVAKLYKSLQNELRDNQHQWLKERDMELARPFCDVECIWQYYKYRIEFLVRYMF
jgi:uncharacterized protein